MLRQLCIPISLLFMLFVSLGCAIADEKEQAERKALEVVGLIQAVEEDSLGTPTAIELKENSNWLVQPAKTEKMKEHAFQKPRKDDPFKKPRKDDPFKKPEKDDPFKKPEEDVSATPKKDSIYKISLEGKGKDLLGYNGKMVKIWGSLSGEQVLNVERYEPLMELFGAIKKPASAKEISSLEFIEEAQPVFKFRSPWTLQIQGDLEKTLMECVDKDVRARGIVKHEGRNHVFQILRFDLVESVLCTLENVEEGDESGTYASATLREKDGDRKFLVHIDENAKEMLNSLEVGSDVEVRGVIEDKEGTMCMQIATYEKATSESEESDTEEDKTQEEEEPFDK